MQPHHLVFELRPESLLRPVFLLPRELLSLHRAALFKPRPAVPLASHQRPLPSPPHPLS
jgi:hypothetical protein